MNRQVETESFRRRRRGRFLRSLLSRLQNGGRGRLSRGFIPTQRHLRHDVSGIRREHAFTLYDGLLRLLRSAFLPRLDRQGEFRQRTDELSPVLLKVNEYRVFWLSVARHILRQIDRILLFRSFGPIATRI